jgi:Arabinose efflux permease
LDTSRSVRSDTNSTAFGWRFTAPLYIGSALNPVNSTFIATALVSIASAVGITVGQAAVLVAALYMACIVAQPAAGKLSETFGPRRVFLAGILAVLAGGVIGGFGHDLTTLIVSRILIGIGTSTGYPSAMLLIRNRAESAGMTEPPGNVLGGLVIAGMATAVIGLPIGGFLVSAWGWQSVFLINVPLALLALCMALFWIPEDPPYTPVKSAREVAARIDLAGITIFCCAMAAVLLFLQSLPDPAWTVLGIAILAGLAFLWWERTVRRPFIDIRLLVSNRPLMLTYMRFTLATLCVYTVLYGVTQWILVVKGISAAECGLLIVPMSLMSVIIAWPVSRLNMVRIPLIVSAAACLAGSLGMLLFAAATPMIWIMIITGFFGVTMGLCVSANQTTLYTQVATDHISTASGLFRTFGYLGSIASSALITVFFTPAVSDQGLHGIAVIMVIFSIVGLGIVLADKKIMSRQD